MISASDGKDADPEIGWLDYDKSSRRSQLLEHTQCLENHRLDRIRHHVLSADLNHARAGRVRKRQEVTEIKVMSEDDKPMLASPSQDLPVLRSRISNRGPVEGLDALLLEDLPPFRREVHIDQDLHPRATGTSSSSTRHVAYVKAARMSSLSRYG